MFFWRMGADLGIDLGTATVLIYEKGKGIILSCLLYTSDAADEL